VALLFVGAVDDEPLRADAVVRADQRAERRRRPRDLECGEHFFFHRQAEAAVFLGNRQTEEPEFTHLADDVSGNLIRFGDFVFGGHETLAHEARQRIEKNGQCFLVADHRSDYLCAVSCMCNCACTVEGSSCG
jgi:hypothetical protein